jgi:hypothetical protein
MNDNSAREYRYQHDWSIGNQMFHVRCDDWEDFKEACENMETILPKEGFPNDTGNIAQKPDATVLQAPDCPVHGTPMKLHPAGVSKAGKPYKAFWSCGQKNADGTWCNAKPTI